MTHKTQINRWLVASVGLAGVMLVLFVNHLGAGLSPDSAGYMAAARSLASGNGIRWFNGELITWWPPLYPAVLALVSILTGADPLSCALGLNAIVFGLIIYVSGILLSYHVSSSPALVLAGTIAVLASIPVFSVSIMVWSESLFLLFVVCYLLSIGWYVDRPNGTWFVALTLSTAFACLTRYIGVTLILSGSLSILVLCRGSLKKRLLACLSYGFASSFPVMLWLIHNYMQTRTLTGPRTFTADARAILVLGEALHTIDAWFLPTRLLAHTPSAPVLITLWGLLILAAGVFWCRTAWYTARSVLPVMIFALIYFAFLTTSAVHMAFDPIDDRLLSPVFIPLLVVALTLVAQGMRLVHGRLSKRALNMSLAVFFSIWLGLVPAKVILWHVQQRATLGGWQYGSNVWQQSETIWFVKNQMLPPGCSVYSNDPYALYLHTGLPVDYAPRWQDLMAQQASRPTFTPACFIWFSRYSSTPHAPDSQQQAPALSPLATFSDGAIYLFDAKPWLFAP